VWEGGPEKGGRKEKRKFFDWKGGKGKKEKKKTTPQAGSTEEGGSLVE